MTNKRDQIIEQTSKLFHQFGTKSVSMDDIARELGMSKKTLYQSVKDKNELVESVVNYNLKLYETFLTAFHNPDLNALEQFFTFSENVQEHFPKYNPSMLYDLRKYYPTLLNKINNKKQQMVFEANVANLDKGIKEGFCNVWSVQYLEVAAEQEKVSQMG